MKKITILLLIIILSIFMGCNDLSPGLTPSEGEGEGEGEGEAEATGERVVLIELFNTEGCAASAVANPIAEQLAEEYGTDKIILVEEAGWGVYSNTETTERFSWYVPGEEKHTPFIAINGLNETLGSVGSIGSGGGSAPSPAPTPGPTPSDNDSEYEKMAQTTDEAIDEFVANCEIYGEEQAKQLIIDLLLGKEGVIDAGIGVDNDSIWFQWENGIISSFSEYPELDDQQKDLSRSFDDLGIITDSKDTRNTPENNKAIIFDWEVGRLSTIYAKEIKILLEAADYIVEFCPKNEFTLYELENINEYGVIYLNSHGFGDDVYGIKILTGQEASVETGEVWTYFKKEYGDDIYGSMIGTHAFYKKIDGVEEVIGRYFCFYPNFIREIALYESFPKSLAYADTCYGLTYAGTDIEKSMADAFIDRGAYAYCGYNGKTYAGCAIDSYVFTFLTIFGMNLETAISTGELLPDIPFICSGLDFYPENKGDLYLVGWGQEIFPEIGAWTITGYDPYCIQVFDTENIPDRSILVYWPQIVGVEEYRVYRSVNGDTNFNLVYSGDGITEELDVDNNIGWYDFYTTPGNSYSYKVSCVVNGQESIPSDAVTRSVWLPECSLASPPNYNPDNPYDQPVTEPEPLLEWNPVGVSSYPYQGDIQSGKSEIWVVAYNTPYPVSGQGEGIWAESFDDLTTSATRFDPNAASRPLVPGSDHIYAWESKGIGYDHNEDIIAVSWSGARHFFYMEPSTTISPPVEFMGGLLASTLHSTRSRSITRGTLNDDSSGVLYYSGNLGDTLSRGGIYHAIDVAWWAYDNCTGYRVYRSTNGSEYEMILNWDTTGLISSGFGFYDSDIALGNTYSYYVTAYNVTENWETVPSNIFNIEIDNETFLPPIYLDQPPDYGQVNDPNYLFEWIPIGNILPYGDVVEGETWLRIFDAETLSSLWSPLYSDNFTTSQVTYNGNPLISGNTYWWVVRNFGYDTNGQIIAESRSEYWEFTYTGTSVESPTVTTLEAYTITKTAATLWGEIVSTGGLTVTRRGFEYRDSAGGSTFDWHEDGDWSANDYIYRITNLLAGHTYLYRAYAVNDQGTGYGAWESFKTTEEIITSPSVTTVGADNIQETSIRFKGRIDDTGGEDADWRGFRIEDTVTGWIYSPKQESGPYGTGDYYITYITLSPGHTYKYKACAHNSAGTSYGTEKSVTTQVSKQLTSIESSISSVSLRWGQMLMPMDYTITAHYSDGPSADIWHINCTWSSSKPDIVNVNDGGMITPLVKTADFAVVTMEYTEGGITKSDTIAVTVLPYP